MKDKLRNAIDNQDGICFFGTTEEKEALVSDIYALIEQERIEIAVNLRREWNKAIVERLEDMTKLSWTNYVDKQVLKDLIQELKGK